MFMIMFYNVYSHMFYNVLVMLEIFMILSVRNDQYSIE